MSMSFYLQGYKRLAQVIYEWQDADRAALLSAFIALEVMLHWAWCLMIWFNGAKLSDYVHLQLLPLLWSIATVVAIFFFWLTYYFRNPRHSASYLLSLQWLLTIVYSLYMVSITLIIGYSSLMAGVSLVGGAMLAMLLINRRMVWYAFVAYLIFIIIFSILPYYGIVLPSMRKLPIHPLYIEDMSTFFSSPLASPSYIPMIHAHLVEVQSGMSAASGSLELNDRTQEVNQVLNLQRENIIFWRLSYLYFALPKAVVIVQLFRTLLSFIERNTRTIQYNAEHDALTGIKNRRVSLTWLHQSLFEDNAKEAKADYSVIMIDLDAFKAINDGYGHHGGDLVLQDIARLLEHALIRRHLVSRYGGEEFLVALPETDHETAMIIAEALRREIEAHCIKLYNNQSVKVTASMGVASWSGEEVTGFRQNYRRLLYKDKIRTAKSNQITKLIIQDFIELADSALYEAKRQGRNRVESANLLILDNKLTKPPCRFSLFVDTL